MTDPKKPEAMNEKLVTAQSELSDEEPEGLAGGIMIPGGGVGFEDRPHGFGGDANDIVLKMKKNFSGASDPGGMSF